MNASLPVFESTMQKSNLWLKDLSAKLGTASSQEAYQALRTVLHALRDRLTVDESAEFAAQMPMLIRGMYFEGWNPGSEATFERSREAFLDDVVDRFDGRWKDTPEQLVRTVFRFLSERISAGEMRDVAHLLPKPVRNLWPEEIAHRR